MSQADIRNFFIKKSYEISYALYRVAAHGNDQGLSSELRALAIAIYGAVLGSRYQEVLSQLEVLEHLIQFGKDVGYIGPSNAALLSQESGNLYSAIAEYGLNPAIAGLPDNDLENLFVAALPSRIRQREKALENNVLEDDIEVEANAAKIAIRQSAIIDKIRQSGNCRLKDIQEAFPDSSERTLRYDLQKLVEQGLVRRVGVGPSTAYRVSNSEVIPSSGV